MSDVAKVKPAGWAEGGKAIASFESLPNGRKRLCGAWTLHGTTREGQRCTHGARGAHGRAIAPAKRYVRLRCKCWSCSLCGPRKAILYRAQILRAISKSKLTRLLTLTLDVRKFANPAEQRIFFEHLETRKAMGSACSCPTCSALRIRSIKHIRKCWSKLRTYMRRRYGVAPSFVAVMEFQKAAGMAHLHIVIDRYIEQAWIKESWQGVGGGQHVDIRHIDAHRAAAYLSKYLSKDMLLNAPPGMRRVTTSRSITLSEKKDSPYDWEVVKAPIDRFFVLLFECAVDVVRNEGELASFAVRELRAHTLR